MNSAVRLRLAGSLVCAAGAIALSGQAQTVASVASTVSTNASKQVKATTQAIKQATGSRDIFTGGMQSLAMFMAGVAEGNVNLAGGINPNYYGHRDIDGHWNIGRCSESDARNGTNLGTPEKADEYCYQKLKGRYSEIQRIAKEAGIKQLTLMDELHGLDLYNQAPAAVVGIPGLYDRLVEARAKGLTALPELNDSAGSLPPLSKEDAEYVDARTEAFSPDPASVPPSQRYYITNFDDPDWLRRDQRRRTSALTDAVKAYYGKQGKAVPVAFTPSERVEVAYSILSKANQIYRGDKR